ncbi:MAG: PLDc_N domain-containing protein [Anaerolineales bacterium]|nr:PLDc_N domain-containing protein [Anaerolineales bacterium]MCB8936986.1 PLDc_N domain-containing protein [Ardenticatenaceae bacterium]
MEFITNNLPLLIPIFLIQLALIVFALLDLARRENTRGPKWVWVLVILFVNFIGPIIYFLVGREDA